MIFLNESMVNEIVVENNNTITFEQFDYFRESTYYSINQIIAEFDMNMILTEGKIMDTLKTIMQKIKQLIQRFIEWVVGIIKKIKNLIFGRKKKLDNLKSNVDTKAQKAKQEGEEYINVKEPLKTENHDDGEDSSSNIDKDNNQQPSTTTKKHRGSKGPNFKDYKIESKIDINVYQISRENYLHSYFNDVTEPYGNHRLGVDSSYFNPKYARLYANDSGPEILEERLNELNNLKYDFDITKAIDVSKEKISNTVDGYKDTIDRVNGINRLNENIIDDLQRMIDKVKKFRIILDIKHDHSEATAEQKQNLLKTASLMSDLNNTYLKKMTELIQFTVKINDIIFEKNMNEIEKFTIVAV